MYGELSKPTILTDLFMFTCNGDIKDRDIFCEYIASDLCSLDSFNTVKNLTNWRECYLDNTVLVATNAKPDTDLNELYEAYNENYNFELFEIRHMPCNIECYSWFFEQEPTFNEMEREYMLNKNKAQLLFSSKGTSMSQLEEDFLSILQ